MVNSTHCLRFKFFFVNYFWHEPDSRCLFLFFLVFSDSADRINECVKGAFQPLLLYSIIFLPWWWIVIVTWKGAQCLLPVCRWRGWTAKRFWWWVKTPNIWSSSFLQRETVSVQLSSMWWRFEKWGSGRMVGAKLWQFWMDSWLLKLENYYTKSITV